MKKVALYIVLIFIATLAKAQNGIPMLQGYGTFGGFEDTPITVPEVTPDLEDEKDKKEPEKKPEKEEKKVPVDSNNVKNKIEIERLELEARRLKLEEDVAALKNKNQEKPLTPSEQQILDIKNENLRLINYKEQLLIKQGLEDVENSKKKKKYPESDLYGHETFRSDNFNLYQTTSEVVATEGYVLGTGDVVQIELWGYKYWSKSYVISENGNIDISGYTNLFVKGLTLKQARSLIASRLGVSGNTSSMAITVTRPRMVSVTILGEVFNPGTYTLPATNSAFNFLVAMGGPSNIGSVRNIYIKRDGRIQDSFDLYEYFNQTMHTRDVYLQNGDYIIVSPLSNVVRISGAVRKPGIYEIKNNEDIGEALTIAGGGLRNTYLKDVMVTRFYNDKFEVVSVNHDSLRAKGKPFKLKGTESIVFKSINSEINTAVNISGGVSVPGSYKLKSEMRISGIIRNANGLTGDAYLDRAYLVRTDPATSKKEFYTFSPKDVLANPGNSEDIKVLNSDSIYIFRLNEITSKNTISITGSVYKPFSSQYINKLKLGEMIFMAGGYTPDFDANRGYILRTRDEYYKEIIPFNPSLVSKDSNMFNLEILPKDVVRVFSRSDQFKSYKVRISGAIKSSDTTLLFADKLTVYDLVRLCGGLEEFALEEKAILTRTNFENNKKQTFVVNLKEILLNPGHKDNLDLEKGDYLYILDKRNLLDLLNVSITGEVKSPQVIEFSENLFLSSFILKAGGLKATAFKKRALIISTDLSTGVKSSKTINLENALSDLESQDNVLIQPGDIIYIFNNNNVSKNFEVMISGPVNKEGSFEYADNMTIQNLLDLAGGLMFSSAGSKIEIVRNFEYVNNSVVFLEPEVLSMTISTGVLIDTQTASFKLMPFDKVFVRQNPNYLPLRTILLEGAVYYPGLYALQGDDEHINSILRRAGGFRNHAYPEGSILKRIKGKDTLSIVLNSKKAYKRRHSNYNYILQDGDVISIPYNENIVYISGDLNTRINTMGVYYKTGKRARYYVKNFAGGFTKTSDKRHLVVEHKGGGRVGTRNYVFFKVFPKLKPGSSIIVASKPVKTPDKKFNVDKALNTLITRTTAILTVIGLYKIAVSN